MILACTGAGLLRTQRVRLGKVLLGSVLGLFSLIAVPPLDNWMLYPLETRFPVPADLGRVDGIIVLSGAFSAKNSAWRSALVLNQYAQRLTKFMELAGRYPDAKLVFSGGAVLPLPNNVTEPKIGRWFFTGQGLDPQRILFADKSGNTHENIVFSRRLAQPQAGERWVLLTSAAHLPRAVGLMRKTAGRQRLIPQVSPRCLPPPPLTAPDLGGRLERLDTAVKESAGLSAYYLLGCTSSIFPGPE